MEDQDWKERLDDGVLSIMKEHLEKAKARRKFNEGRKMISAVNNMIQEIEHAIQSQSMSLGMRSTVLLCAIEISRSAAFSRKIFATKNQANRLTKIIIDA